MRKESARILAALLIVLPGHAAAPPARAQELGCVRDQKPMLAVELLFGRNIGGRHGVTEARWQRFVAREITPRFPDGYTVLDGRGHWRDPKGRGVVREHSKMVMLVAADDEATQGPRCRDCGGLQAPVPAEICHGSQSPRMRGILVWYRMTRARTLEPILSSGRFVAPVMYRLTWPRGRRGSPAFP